MMRDQLDLRIEAKNLIRFTEKFKNETWASFPKPIHGYVERNVLVETLEEGIPLSEYTKLGMIRVGVGVCNHGGDTLAICYFMSLYIYTHYVTIFTYTK